MVETNEFIAGEPGEITIEIQDQYGNPSPVTQVEGLSVDLIAWNGDPDEEETRADGKFYDSNELNVDGMPVGNEIDHIIIPQDQSRVVCYYYDTHATNDPNYEVWLEADAGLIREYYEFTWINGIDIMPAAAQKVAMSAIEREYELAGNCFALQAKLLDQYGNMANPQGELLTVDLSSSSDTGVFYDAEVDDENNGHLRISQVTFGRDYWNGEAENAKIVFYMDTTAGEVTVSAGDQNLESVLVHLNVLPAPQYIELIPVDESWTVGQRGRVEIKLYEDAEHTTLYTVPEDLTEGLDIELYAEPFGFFFDDQVEGRVIDEINIEPGTTSSAVYYLPIMVKENTLYGYYDGDNGELDLEGQSEPFIVNPAPGLAVLLTDGDDEYDLGTDGTPFNLNCFDYIESIAGKVGEVKLTVVDQLINPVADGEYAVDLYAKMLTTSELGDMPIFESHPQDWMTDSETGCFYPTVNEAGGRLVPVVDAAGYPRFDADGKLIVNILDADGNALLNEEQNAVETAVAPITQAVIPNDCDSITVYYYDTQATGKDYRLVLATDAQTIHGEFTLATVKEDVAAGLTITVNDLPYYDDLKIDNMGYYDAFSLKGNAGETDKLLANRAFPIEMDLVDQNGNLIDQKTPLVVNLETETMEGDACGKFYYRLSEDNMIPINHAIVCNGEFYDEKIINQSIDEDTLSPIELVFVPSGTGKVKIMGNVNGLPTSLSDILTVQAVSQLEIHFPLIEEYNSETDTFLEYEDNTIEPDQRKSVYILLTDDQGHPDIAKADTEVTLTGADFYISEYDPNPVPTVTIKKGSHGIKLLVEGTLPEGIKTLGALASGLNSAAEDLEIVQYPYFTKELQKGWNIISAPVALQKKTLDQIIDRGDDVIKLAYAYDATAKRWKVIDKVEGQWKEMTQNEQGETLYGSEFTLEPMDVVLVNLKVPSLAKIYPMKTPTGPYSRNLKKGWNLIGPAIDLNNVKQQEPYAASNPACDWYETSLYFESVDFVLRNIAGDYSRVISPRIGEQLNWVCLPEDQMLEDYYMGVTQGYWIYMDQEAALNGYSYTPVGAGGCVPYNDPNANYSYMSTLEDSENTPPPLPAAFWGDVKDADGNAIEEGMIEAVIEGIVRGRIHFTNGQFGISDRAKLIVQSMSGAGVQEITFLVNGIPAQETLEFAAVSGDLRNITLTVDTSSVVIGYNGLQVVTDQQVALSFNTPLMNNLADEALLKAAITYSDDGMNFVPLGENDQVAIEDNRLIITFSEKLMGNTNIVKLAADALKDGNENVLNTAVETVTFAVGDQPIDECFIATAAYGTKFGPAVTLLRQFRDQFLMNHELGRKFVDFYYTNSPAVAHQIAGSPFLKLLVRIALTPVVILVFLLFNPVILVSLLLLAGVGFMNRRKRWSH